MFVGDQAIAVIASVGIIFVLIGHGCIAISNKVCLCYDVHHIDLQGRS